MGNIHTVGPNEALIVSGQSEFKLCIIFVWILTENRSYKALILPDNDSRRLFHAFLRNFRIIYTITAHVSINYMHTIYLH